MKEGIVITAYAVAVMVFCFGIILKDFNTIAAGVVAMLIIAIFDR